MRTVSAISLYEFKMQIRSLAFWLTTLALVFFWHSEVFSGHQSHIAHAIATQPAIMSLPGGFTIDLTAEAHEALKVANFSTYAGWLFADRFGLMSALFIGLLASFVFERDRTYDLLDVINSREVKSWQYVLGKYFGVVLSWGLPFIAITVVEIGSVYQMSQKASLTFAFRDFLAPVFAWIGISLLYGTAMIMFLSLVLKSGVGTLLIHFFYWVYCVFHMAMFQTENSLLFLTYWFFRQDTGLSPRAVNLVTNKLSDIIINRSLYVVLAIVLFGLTARNYQLVRERGVWTSAPRKERQLFRWSRRVNVDSDE